MNSYAKSIWVILGFIGPSPPNEIAKLTLFQRNCTHHLSLRNFLCEKVGVAAVPLDQFGHAMSVWISETMEVKIGFGCEVTWGLLSPLQSKNAQNRDR